MTRMLNEGATCVQVEQSMVAQQVKSMIKSYFCGVRAGVGNITMFISDTCDQFLKDTPDYELAVAYRFNSITKTWDFSLRSRQNGSTNCFEIAKKFGGGGHMNAAGFKIHSGECVINFLTKNGTNGQ